MPPQKEDIVNIDRILEMYVQDEISNFEVREISKTLSIEHNHARFLISKIRELNDELSLLKVDQTNSGSLYPIINDKFLVHRFIKNGGYQKYLEEKANSTDIEDLSQRIDLILSGLNKLLRGQVELDENGERRILELKELLTPILLKKTSWSDVIKGQVMSALIALGVNPDNLESLITSIQNSIDI